MSAWEMKLGVIGRCFVLFGLVTFLLAAACLADEKQKLTTDRERESYSLGYQFGRSLSQRKMDLDLDVYTSALRDALTGKEPALSQDEIRETIAELQRKASAAHQKEQQEKSDKNLAEGKAFLEENKKKPGVVPLPSGLQYKVLVEGMGRNPTANDTVKVHYRGTLVDGTQIDSSHDRGESAEFKVGSVIRGWMEALQLMKQGSKWQLFIPPALGYGQKGSRAIGPNSTLIFEVELIAVEASEEPAG